MNFECNKTIRFSHCDPAGIVFYPRYVELINEVVEDWFAYGLGVSFNMLHEELRLGVPTVRLDVEFNVPSRYGDHLTFRLVVIDVGNSSVQLRIDALAQERIRLSAKLKVVLTSLENYRSVPIDADWRAKFESFKKH